MSDTNTIPTSELAPAQAAYTSSHDVDPAETQEWLDSLEYVLKTKGAERVKFLLEQLENKSRREGIELPAAMNTSPAPKALPSKPTSATQTP